MSRIITSCEAVVERGGSRRDEASRGGSRRVEARRPRRACWIYRAHHQPTHIGTPQGGDCLHIAVEHLRPRPRPAAPASPPPAPLRLTASARPLTCLNPDIYVSARGRRERIGRLSADDITQTLDAEPRNIPSSRSNPPPSLQEELRHNLTVSVMSFVPTLEDDGRSLTCRAENPNVTALHMETSWTISVVYPPVVKLRLGSSLAAGDIKEGDDVYFECHVRANPPARKLSWLHDGQSVALLQHGDTRHRPRPAPRAPRACRQPLSVLNTRQSYVLKGSTEGNEPNMGPAWAGMGWQLRAAPPPPPLPPGVTFSINIKAYYIRSPGASAALRPADFIENSFPTTASASAFYFITTEPIMPVGIVAALTIRHTPQRRSG
ncbi:unnamed protein product [Plutella xylostella]|uniref:(diamondback moth) hypothetical protein n=1 Tax=Plutella xylostella TaxID=51655 RepID=A0A8S4FZI0_PLUXY|nr:unnamed protein product [Plutella xylostella]